ncbi:hypothetical protein PlfCFBP13513_17070 [Plantibacter flavus]|uniref:NAD-dependent epimerase/dehydratase family protein n=1 Tax=Plantibacter flavus TaxID=150123 RepID=UPI0010C1EE33|nr:hypothetical protein PlfCFBP13513_17070 [Plantibacter flavus]
MTRLRVALTGSTGMIGRRIGDALAGRGASVTVLSREDRLPPHQFSRVLGTLRDHAALTRLVAGADVLIHAASYVGPDEDLQRETNIAGTVRLYRTADLAGVRRIVYLSTTGVYGDSYENGATELTAIASPASPLSHSRRAAEVETLSRGGVVLRPNLVAGEGDRWFLLPLVGTMARLGGWIGSDHGKVSWIDSGTLGQVAAGIAVAPDAAGVFHAAYPEPVPIRDLVLPVLDAAKQEPPIRSLAIGEAAAALAPLGVTRRALAMIAGDRWINADKLWSKLPALPQTPAMLGARDLGWYVQSLAAAPDR